VNIDPSFGRPSGVSTGSQVSPPRTATDVKPHEASVAAHNPSAAVQLSSQFRSLEAQASESTSFDSKKVQAIKAAIAEGRFQVDAAKVADGLIATVEDLIHSRSRSA